MDRICRRTVDSEIQGMLLAMDSHNLNTYFFKYNKTDWHFFQNLIVIHISPALGSVNIRLFNGL